MFRSSGSKKALTIASRVAGWGLMALAAAWFLYCVLRGGYFLVGDTEINLRDPILIIWKTLGIGVLGLLLLGRKESFVPAFRFLGTRRGMWCLWATVASLFVGFSLLRYHLLSDSAFDTATFKLYFYRIAYKGSIDIFVNAPRNMLGDHLFLFFFPYALFYRIGGMDLVIIIHKILLSSVVPLSYLLGKTANLNQEKIGFLALLAPLAPGFAQVGVGDLYAEGLIYPAGIGVLWAFHARKWLWLAIASIVLVSLREDGGLVLGFMAIYFSLVRRNWRWLLLLVAGTAVSIGLMQWQSSFSHYAAVRLTTRYGITSFTDLQGILRLLFRLVHPKSLLAFVFLMLGFGLLPFLSWRGVVSSYCAAFPNLASAYFRQAQLRAYYGNFVYPIILGAISEVISSLKTEHFRVHALIALSAALLLGPRCLKHRFDWDYISQTYRAMAMIPSDSSVAVTSAIANRLPPRDTLYIIKRFEDIENLPAPYILIEETDVYYRHHWQRALDYLKSSGYTEQFSGGGVHLLVRKQNP